MLKTLIRMKNEYLPYDYNHCDHFLPEHIHTQYNDVSNIYKVPRLPIKSNINRDEEP